VEKLVEREEPGKNQGRERARLFELESSTWNKLLANNFRTHTHTNCGHTYTVACVSSPLLVSISACESAEVGRCHQSKLRASRGQALGRRLSGIQKQRQRRGVCGESSRVGEFPDAPLVRGGSSFTSFRCDLRADNEEFDRVGEARVSDHIMKAHQERTDYISIAIYRTITQKERVSKQVHRSFSYPNRSA